MKLENDILKRFLDFEEDEDVKVENKHGPCWNIKVNKEKQSLLFLIDGEIKLTYPLSKMQKDVTLEFLASLLEIFKAGNMNALRKKLKSKK
jgi:hypothetical protein